MQSFHSQGERRTGPSPPGRAEGLAVERIADADRSVKSFYL